MNTPLPHTQNHQSHSSTHSRNCLPAHTDLVQLMQGKTTLVIAHRLSTIQHMDRILVFDGGCIVEDGAHEALLQKNGVYTRLWNTHGFSTVFGILKKEGVSLDGLELQRQLRDEW